MKVLSVVLQQIKAHPSSQDKTGLGAGLHGDGGVVAEADDEPTKLSVGSGVGQLDEDGVWG